jgi:hypothetical protein
MASRTLTLVVLVVAVVLMVAAPSAIAQTVQLPTIEFQCYVIQHGAHADANVRLTDQFGAENALVQESQLLCNPAKKVFNGNTFGGQTVTIPVPTGATTITIAVPHLQCYKIVPSSTVDRNVKLTDQFGTEAFVSVTGPQVLCTTVVKTDLKD